MAGSLHGSARTTPRVRAELQASQEKSSILAKRYVLSVTTVDVGGEFGVGRLFAGAAVRRTRFRRSLRPREECKGQLGGRTGEFATSIGVGPGPTRSGW